MRRAQPLPTVLLEKMNSAVEILHKQSCSLVIQSRGEVHTFFNRGIKDLYNIYTTDKSLLYGAAIADKVVGRAAAALMILGGVERIYTDTISKLALELLATTDIVVEYAEVVPHIINRTKTDLCPMERATRHLTDLNDIFRAIDDFVRSLA